MVEALAEQQEELPADIVAFIDSLDPAGIEGMSPSGVAKLRLRHGSTLMEDGPLELVDAQLAVAAEAFAYDMENLTVISPDTGLPTAVLNDTAKWNTYSSPIVASSGQLSTWLECARDNLPETVDEVLEGIVDAAGEFDPDQFELALGLAKEDFGHKGDNAASLLRGDARHLAAAIISKLRYYSMDIELLRRGASLPLVKRYSREEELSGLQLRILQLERQRDPGYRTTEYDEFATRVGTRFISDRLNIYGSTELSWLIQQDPSLAADLIAQNPAHAAKVRKLAGSVLLGLDEADRSPAHTTALAELEQQVVQDLAEYTDFLHALFKRSGELSDQQLTTLADLVLASPGTEPSGWACSILCALAPQEQLVRILNERPRLLQYGSEIGAMSVRRLARAGLIDQAKAIAEQPLCIDSANARFNPIYNFLAIYEESGDEAAWDEAERRGAAIGSERFYTYPTYWYKAVVRQFEAARKQGNMERAEAAAATLETFYSHDYHDVREYSLSSTVRLFLDSGELDKAELMAARLYQHYANDALDRYRYHRFDALFSVMDAYTKAGQPEAATEIVRRYVLSEPQPDYHVSTAVDALKDGPDRWIPHMFASHLDDITEFLSWAHRK